MVLSFRTLECPPSAKMPPASGGLAPLTRGFAPAPHRGASPPDPRRFAPCHSLVPPLLQITNTTLRVITAMFIELFNLYSLIIIYFCASSKPCIEWNSALMQLITYYHYYYNENLYSIDVVCTKSTSRAYHIRWFCLIESDMNYDGSRHVCERAWEQTD